MKLLILLYFFGGAFFLVGSSCNPIKNERLIWSDEFEYSGKPDSSNWNYELGNGCPKLCGWGNNEEEVYSDQPSNVRVENGKMILQARKTNHGWTSGKITTQRKMNFTYGRVEFRAKLPEGKGSWPALWMLPENIVTIGWPACGEIDVMEHVGRNPAVVQSAIHTTASFGETINKNSTIVDSFHSDFHTYEVIWTKEKLAFLVDGVSYYVFQPEKRNADTWPFDSPFFIIMNVAMGGGLGGPIDTAITQAKMEVDYVRVYQ